MKKEELNLWSLKKRETGGEEVRDWLVRERERERGLAKRYLEAVIVRLSKKRERKRE